MRLKYSLERIIIAPPACHQNLSVDLVSLFQVVITSKKYPQLALHTQCNRLSSTQVILQILLVVIKGAVSQSHLD